jgi:ATP-dependent DNA helicase RecG
MQKHPSIPRNRNIADIFFKAGYIEAWGRGIDKIKQGFRDAGKPNPLFEELGGGFMITLFKGTLDNVSDKVVEKVAEKVAEKLTVNQLSILKLISDNQHITATELANNIGISHRKTQENIGKLKEMGLIRRIGPAKGGHWEVVE